MKTSAEGSVKGSGPHQLRDKVPMPRKKLTKGLTVVPMEGNAYNLQFVEKHGKQTGYMSNEGPVKVLRLPAPPCFRDPPFPTSSPQILCLMQCVSPHVTPPAKPLTPPHKEGILKASRATFLQLLPSRTFTAAHPSEPSCLKSVSAAA